MSIKLHFDSDPAGLEALQRLLRLAASEKAHRRTEELEQADELARVHAEMMAEIRRGNVTPLAWFVYLAGRVTAVAAVTLSAAQDSPDFNQALRTIEELLERELRGEETP